MYTGAVTTALGLLLDHEQEATPPCARVGLISQIFKCKTIICPRDGKAGYSWDERMELQEGHLGGRSGQQSNEENRCFGISMI